jgi:predicted aspartyl protease
MIHRFNPLGGLILIDGLVAGPIGVTRVRLAIDTGATSTVLHLRILENIGYDSSSATSVEIGTGSGKEGGKIITVEAVQALGITNKHIEILSFSLPNHIKVDGVLGLDFFRNRRLCIDFAAGEIELT